MATVGPQYQSQLALLAGALGSGGPAFAPTALQLYQDTLAQAQAAQQARQQAIQATLGQIGQVASSATTPEQAQAAVKIAKASLPYGGTKAVQQGAHQVLGALQNSPGGIGLGLDPLQQAQLTHEQLLNQQLADQMGSGGPNALPLYGATEDAQIQQTVQDYDAKGVPLPQIRNSILSQLGTDASTAQGMVISRSISQAYVKLHPEFAAQLPALQGPAAAPQAPAPGPSPLVSDVEGGAAAGAGLGALAGLLPAPLAPITVPVGTALGAIGGGLGGALAYGINRLTGH